jgi:hypothetical protein
MFQELFPSVEIITHIPEDGNRDSFRIIGAAKEGSIAFTHHKNFKLHMKLHINQFIFSYKVKVRLNAMKARRRSEVIAPLTRNLGTRWGSSQAHSPAALLPRRNYQYALTRRLGWPSFRYKHIGEETNFFPLPRFEPRIVQHVV